MSTRDIVLIEPIFAKRMKIQIFASLMALAASTAFAGNKPTSISGDYLEVRSCDVYTGPCFANAEMGLTGREGMMVWSVQEGAWNGVDLKGLGVIAVVKTDGTLGHVKYQPRTGETVLIVDSKADARQRTALAEFARSMAGHLISEVVQVETAPIETKVGGCHEKGCASVKAGDLVQVATSCLGGKHDVCGNEETFYPPLTEVEQSYPVYTDLATFQGKGLDLTWQIAGTRSAFLAKFSAESGSGSSKLALK